MPAQFPKFDPSSDEPSDVLRKFLDEVYNLMGDILIGSSNDGMYKGFVEPNFRNRLISIWKSAMPRYLDEVKIGINKASGADLDRHGLQGEQLSIKLDIIGHIYKTFQDKPGVNLIKRLISAIDTLLESILAALGVGSALVEFKDFVMHAIPDQ